MPQSDLSTLLFKLSIHNKKKGLDIAVVAAPDDNLSSHSLAFSLVANQLNKATCRPKKQTHFSGRVGLTHGTVWQNATIGFE